MAEVDAALDEYRFADAAQALYRFVWSEFCDWGLELEKGRLEGDAQERADATQSLAWILERTLRLLHPTMPFVTEEIWQRFRMPDPEALAIAAWPAQEPRHIDPEAERPLGLVQEVVSAVRQFRSRHGIPPKERFDAVAGVPGGSIEAVDLAGRLGRAPGRRRASAGDGRGGGEAARLDHRDLRRWVRAAPARPLRRRRRA